MEMNASSLDMEMNETGEASNVLPPEDKLDWGDLKTHEERCWLKFYSAAKIIAPFGLLFNITLLVVVARVKSMRTILNVYLSNLAVADSSLLFGVTLQTWISAGEEPSAGLKFVLGGVGSTLQFASYYFVTAVAFERFLAIRRPLEFRARASRTRAAKISAGLWVLAMSGGVVTAFFQKPYIDLSKFGVYYMILVIVIYTSTLTVTVFSYLYIILKLRSQRANSPDIPQQVAIGKVLRMLLLNTAVFFLLNSVDIALAILVIITTEAKSEEEFYELLWVSVDIELSANIMNLINSSINPVVYSMTNEDYRAALFKTFPCLGPIRRCLLCFHHGRRPNHTHPQVRGKQIELADVRPPKRAQQ